MDFHAHNTAISRSTASRPARLIIRPEIENRIQTDRFVHVLDYGCGRGADAKYYRSLGAVSVGYDPHEPFGYSHMPAGLFDVVSLTYVLNAIPSIEDRVQCLAQAASKVRENGTLFVSVRTVQDVWSAAVRGQWGRFGDGFISSPSRRTFQTGIGFEQMEDLFDASMRSFNTRSAALYETTLDGTYRIKFLR